MIKFFYDLATKKMGAKPSSSANFPRWVARFPPTDFPFWTDKSSWKTKPSSLAATPSSLAATKPSSSADKSPPLRSTNYKIPPGLDPTKFKEYIGGGLLEEENRISFSQ